MKGNNIYSQFSFKKLMVKCVSATPLLSDIIKVGVIRQLSQGFEKQTSFRAMLALVLPTCYVVPDNQPQK